MTERDAEWELQHLYALFYGDLGLCCGNPEDGFDLVRELLELTPTFEDGNWHKVENLVGSSGGAHLVIGMLDRAGLLEHGSSIMGSWLTDKGKYVRYMLRRHEFEASEYGMEHPDGVHDMWFPHDGEDCTDDCWKAPAGLDLGLAPEPTVEELAEATRKEAADYRARLSPAQLAMMDQVDATMESYMLYGQAVPPYVSDLPRVIAEHPDGERIGREFTGILASMAGSYTAWLNQPANRVSVSKFLEGCRQVDGTWIHGRPHDCPKWARG